MKLTDLSPQLLKRIAEQGASACVETLAEADQISFVCPKCFAANGSKRPGVHSITIPASVLDKHPYSSVYWKLIGTGLADLTFAATNKDGKPSVFLMNGCKAHFHVVKGNIRACAPDSY